MSGDKPGLTNVGPSILNFINKDHMLSWVFLSGCLPAWAEVCSCIRQPSATLRDRQQAPPDATAEQGRGEDETMLHHSGQRVEQWAVTLRQGTHTFKLYLLSTYYVLDIVRHWGH